MFLFMQTESHTTQNFASCFFPHLIHLESFEYPREWPYFFSGCTLIVCYRQLSTNIHGAHFFYVSGPVLEASLGMHQWTGQKNSLVLEERTFLQMDIRLFLVFAVTDHLSWASCQLQLGLFFFFFFGARGPVGSFYSGGPARLKDDLQSQLSKHASERSPQLPLQQNGYENAVFPLTSWVMGRPMEAVHSSPIMADGSQMLPMCWP